MIPQWKMNGKDMRFDGSIEIGVVEVRDLFDDLVVTVCNTWFISTAD